MRISFKAGIVSFAAGPWSDPVFFDFEGIDPSLFFDDDGRTWMVNNGAPENTPLYDGHRAIWIQEFDPVAKKMIGPWKTLESDADARMLTTAVAGGFVGATVGLHVRLDH